MGSLEKSPQKILNEIASKGWTVIFNWDGQWDCEGAFAGDCNCPHPKEYDPKDGHGFSHCEIPLEKLPNKDEDWTFENVLRLIFQEIEKIKPGAPYR